MKKIFEIDLSDSDPLEKEFYDLDLSHDDVKCILLLGYSLYKTGATELLKDTNDRHIQEQCKEIEHQVSQRYEHQLMELRNENVHLVKQLDVQLEKTRSDVEKRFTAEIAALESRAQYAMTMKNEYMQKCIDMEQKVQSLFLKMQEESVDHWKQMLKEKETEIRVLKSTNAVKGVLGENLIMQALRSRFDNAEVVDMSHVSHVCDVHMSFPDNSKFVFESKYKQVIDKKDLQKFYHDLEGMGDDVLGGVFVSVLSKNIPGKGSICVETLPNCSKLLLFIGFQDETDFHTYFLPHVQMFMTLCQVHGRKVQHDVDIQAVLDDVNFYYQMITRSKGRLDEFKTKFTKVLQEVDSDHDQILRRIEDVLKRYNYHPLALESADCKPTKKKRLIYSCDQCGIVVDNKRMLTKHTKECHAD